VVLDEVLVVGVAFDEHVGDADGDRQVGVGGEVEVFVSEVGWHPESTSTNTTSAWSTPGIASILSIVSRASSASSASSTIGRRPWTGSSVVTPSTRATPAIADGSSSVTTSEEMVIACPPA